MAEVTLLFKNSVRLGKTAAAVNERALEKSAPGDPKESEQGKQQAEPEFRALQRRRPFEIVEVDALSQLLCCPRSRHSSLATRHFFNIAGPSPHAPRQAKSVPAKAGCAAAAIRAANDASVPDA